MAGAADPHSSAQATPEGAPPGDGALVALDWAELPDGGEDALVKRRVWAPSIADGLAAMVEDRRTDEVLERIERLANADDDPLDAL